MASLGTVFVRIMPDTSGMSGEMTKGLGAMMPGLMAAYAAQGKKIGSVFGDSISKATLASAAAVAAVGVGLFKVGDEFDKAYDKIRIGTGKTGTAFEDLKQSLKNVAMYSSSSIGDIGQALADLNARTGMTGPALETLARQMLIITARTGGDLRTNIRETSRLFGDWSISTDKQSAALDYIFKVSQKTGVGISNLEADIVKFGAPLRQFGFSFEEAAVLLGKWEKEGVNTQTVLAGLRMGLGNLTSETKRASIEKNLGIKIDDQPAVALRQIIDAIKNAGTQAEANQIALQVFGKRAGPDMAAAVREGRFDLDGLIKSVKDSKETIIGAAANVTSFSQAWGSLKNIMKVAIEPVATKMFTELSNLMIGIVRTIRENKTAWEGLSTAFKVLGVAVKIAFEVIRVGVTVFFTWLGIVFKALKYEIQAAITVFQAMGRAFTSVSDTLVAVWQALFRAGKTVFGALQLVWDTLWHAGETAVNALIKAWNTLWHTGETVIGAITKAWNAVVDFFTKLPGRVVDFFKDLPGRMLNIGKTIIGGLADGITTAASAVWDFFKKLPDRIFGAIGFAAGWLTKTGIQVVQGFINGIESAASNIKDFFVKLPDRIKGFIVNAGTWLLNTGKSIMTGLATGLANAYDAVANFFKTLPGRMVGWATGAGTWLLNTGKTIIGGLVNGLIAAYDAVANFFKALPGKMVGWASGAGNWLLNIGKTIIGGLVNGLTSAYDAVANFFKGMPGRITGFLAGAGNWLLNIGKTVINGFVSGLTTAFKAVSDFFTGTPGKITGAMKDAGRWLLQTGKDIITGLLNGILDAIKAIGSWINDHIFRPIVNGFKSAFGIGSPSKVFMDLGKEIIAGLLNGITAAVVAVFNFFKGLGGRVVSALGNAAGWLFQKGKDIIQGLLNGIENAAKGAGNFLGQVGGWIKDNLLDRFNPFGSPSRPMIEAGKNIVAGLTQGIQAAASGATNAMKTVSSSIVGSINAVPAVATTASTRTNAQFVSMSNGFGTLAAQSATRSGQVVLAHNNMATGISGATGRVLVDYSRQQTGVSNLATLVSQKNTAINQSSTAMAGNTDTVTARVVSAFGRHQTGATNLATLVSSKNTSINQSSTAMAGNTDTVTARVLAAFGRHQTGETNLATLVSNKNANINQTSTAMAGNTDTVTARVLAAFGRHQTGETNLATLVSNKNANINQTSTAMAGNTDTVTARVVNAFGRHMTGATNLATLVGTRTGQINQAALAMASTTEGSTTRVNQAYTGMQGKVDSLHGKTINIASLANVTYPAAAVLTSSLAVAVKALQGASPGPAPGQVIADGAIFHRAQGGIDNLPDKAIISPAKGPGLVQWAEAETGGEAFIPLAPAKRRRSLEIWRQTGELLGAFLQGGLLDINTTHDSGLWDARTVRLQTLTEENATYMGKIAAKIMSETASATMAQVATAVLSSALAPSGPGYSANGDWASNIRPWVEYIARSMSISANTYAGHHPAENYAADLAIGQDGMKNTSPGWGISGSDLYSRVAAWLDKNMLGKPSPAWYIGVHAGIHSREQPWHPAGSQMSRRGQTYAHDDHVHISFDPRGGPPMVGVPGNSSIPSMNWDHGGAAPTVAGGIGFVVPAGNFAKSGRGWTQAQMEAAVRAAGASPNVAHIFGAIGMGESGGWNFPSTNYALGRPDTYHSPWQMQERSNPGLNYARLDTDLAYAAAAVFALYQRAGFDPWEVFTTGRFAQWMAEGGILKHGDEGWGRDTIGIDPRTPMWIQYATKRLRRPAIDVGRYDNGGYLQPGVTMAVNKTGRPERVVTADSDDKTTRLLMQLVGLIGEQNALLRRLPGASADALNSVAYRAMARR